MAKIGKVGRYGSCVAIPVKDIVPSPFQVRIDYGDIEGLARDIKSKGLLQPILVRPKEEKYEIVHGHRRFKAIQLLGWKYIDAFVKELTDDEAIRIQGSENIWRKNYSPIEEAKLYDRYRKFVKEKTGRRPSAKEIALAFNKGEKGEVDVKNKLALLDLPPDIQEKIHEGIIPFSKARSLTLLTREQGVPIGTPYRGGKLAPRTSRFYPEIRRLAEEIEKGVVGLRTERGVALAAKAIREGVPVEEAISKAKLEETIEIVQRELHKGKPPQEILEDIRRSQQDPQVVLEATIEANIKLIRKLLRQKLIRCPYCGGDDLIWGCVGKKLTEENEGAGD